MRQFAGFGTAEETNARFRYLLDHGQTGLSTAFDMPTLMGYDSDHPRSLGEVGREGVAVDSLDDMEQLFAGIPLGEVSTSMTINAPAAMLLAFYSASQRSRGSPRTSCAGRSRTTSSRSTSPRRSGSSRPSRRCGSRRHDRVLHPQRAALAPGLDLGLPHSRGRLDRRPGARLHARRRVRLRRAGSSAGSTSTTSRRGSRSSSTRTSTSSKRSRSTGPPAGSGPRAPRALRREERALVAHALPRADRRCLADAQQPEVNIVRTALEALAAVLGGCQSLHTNSFDEALALPTEHAVKLALRTQQVIAHETGVASTIDPLGGSYYLEDLTNRLEQEAYDYFGRIRDLGGVVEAIKENFFQREIAEAVLPLPERGRVRRSGHRRGEPVRGHRRARARDPEDRRRSRAKADRARSGPARAARLGRRRVGALSAQARARPRPTPTSCRRSSTPPARTSPWAKCVMLCARAGASGARPPSS